MLLRLADEHGLVPLLHEHLLGVGAKKAPAEFFSQLQSLSRETALRGLFLSAELFRVLASLRQSGIPAIPYKGPVLAARAFGNPALRQFNDLDIVIPQRFMPVVFEQMSALGYISKLPRDRFPSGVSRIIPGEYVFLHSANRAMVEIHTERTLRHFPTALDLDAMISRATTVEMGGREVPAFSREDELLMLAVHGAKDFWARLIWVADIAELVKQPPEIAWKELFDRANEMKLGRMLRLGLLLARDLLGLPLSTEADREVRKYAQAAKFARRIRAQVLSGALPPNGILQRSAYRIGMVEGIWSGLRYWLRLSTAPAEEDWSMLDVPQPLERSYAILRPLRLWKKYGRRRTSRS
ncbi:MAG TPA: nucleotidyltransferase family protein [Candidatus Acidoferrales bacterium]|nr:nucleotidyltransferase family protein [Candidatus Acidoferrales bacterium]